jgi:hypothetical protein
MSMRTLSIAILLVSVASLCRGADRWEITTTDFRPTAAVISQIDENGVHTSGEKDPLTIPLDRLVRLRRDIKPSATIGSFTLLLQNGDRLTGDPGDLKEESLTWRNPALGEVKFTIAQLAAFSRGSKPFTRPDAAKEDQINLSNRDTIRGIIVGIEDSKILIQVNGDVSLVPLSSVDAVLFSSSKSLSEPKRAWRLGFSDGSRLTAATIGMRDGKFSFSLPGDAPDVRRSTDLAYLSALEQVNGPVSWLSDRAPAASEQASMSSDSHYPAQMNSNVFGKPMRVGSQIFDIGIGVHANSIMRFPLDGTYRFFRTRYAIDTSGDVSKALVNVRILIDGRVAHEQLNFGPYILSPVTTIDLKGAKELTLEVTAAGITDSQDRFNWIESGLVRDQPSANKPSDDAPNRTDPANPQP